MIVEVFVVVPPGANANTVARAALQAQGARPFNSASLGSEGFTATGLVWDILPVIQNYNPGSRSTENEPVDGLAALNATHATWDAVKTSFFDIDFGEITNRCPSLVRECRGRQTFDGNSDVAWLRLGEGILGVTWFSTSIDETDMALSTRFNWANDGVSGFDVETVFLHENGHVTGLGHSDIQEAVMYAYYHGLDRDLYQDDIDGITFLYPKSATLSPLNITTTSLPNGTVNAIYSTNLKVTDGTPPYTWAITAGALPAGLSLAQDTGEISGTPTTQETGSFTVQVTDASGTQDNQPLSITIEATPLESTTVSVASIDYATEGGKNGDKHLLITVALLDGLDDPVAGASVAILLENTTIGKSWTATALTGSGGTVTVSLKNAPSGCYTTTVTDVTADGLTRSGGTPTNKFCK